MSGITEMPEKHISSTVPSFQGDIAGLGHRLQWQASWRQEADIGYAPRCGRLVDKHPGGDHDQQRGPGRRRVLAADAISPQRPRPA